MAEAVKVTGQIRLTLEIQWDASFGEKASAIDIYTTVARECQNKLENALKEGKVGYRIVGQVEPLMVIYPCKKP